MFLLNVSVQLILKIHYTFLCSPCEECLGFGLVVVWQVPAAVSLHCQGSPWAPCWGALRAAELMFLPTYIFISPAVAK